jgi:hypothetical protein
MVKGEEGRGVKHFIIELSTCIDTQQKPLEASENKQTKNVTGIKASPTSTPRKRSAVVSLQTTTHQARSIVLKQGEKPMSDLWWIPFSRLCEITINWLIAGSTEKLVSRQRVVKCRGHSQQE